MTHLAQLIAADTDTMSQSAGSVVLEVLEAAQRLVAYCNNDPVGSSENAELAHMGLPAVKLDRALCDLRHAVQAMNRSMATEEGCAMLASLTAPAHRRVR